MAFGISIICAQNREAGELGRLEADATAARPIAARISEQIAADGIEAPEVGEPQSTALRKVLHYIEVLKSREHGARDLKEGANDEKAIAK